MPIKEYLLPNVWEAIRLKYESADYRGAVLDAINLLRDVLREKSGESIDGTDLASLLSGKSPKIKINKLQTTSEKSEQEGYSFLIRGLYSGIRNPRIHDNIEDNQLTAYSLVLFVNHLITKVSDSEPVYSVQRIGKHIFDSEFVTDSEYLNEIISKLPPKKYLELAYHLLDNREIAPKNISYVLEFLLPRLDVAEQPLFLSSFSTELETKDICDVPPYLNILPKGTWNKLSKVAQKRIENSVIKRLEIDPIDRGVRKKRVGPEYYDYEDYEDFFQDYDLISATLIESVIRHVSDFERSDDFYSKMMDIFTLEFPMPSPGFEFLAQEIFNYITEWYSEPQSVLILRWLDEYIRKFTNKDSDFYQEIRRLSQYLPPKLKDEMRSFPKEFDFGDLSEDDFLDF